LKPAVDCAGGSIPHPLVVRSWQSREGYKVRLMQLSSLLATAGGVVFGGDTNRRIVAFDGTSGFVRASRRPRR
jgi:hypothetical protein